jgi:hypothetical protein
MKRKFLAVICALLFVGIVGCVTPPDAPQTMEERQSKALDAYLVARAQLNDFMQSYSTYKFALSPEQQLEIGEKVVPKFERADDVLDAWQSVVLSGGLGYGNEQIWLQIKKDLVLLLVEVGVIKVEEK